MPFTYTIDEPRRLVRITAEGEVGADAWFAMLADALADPRYQPGFDLLFDRSGLAHVPDARHVQAWVPEQGLAMRRAGARRMAVIVSQPVVYGMMRMASVYAETEGFALEPYWSEADALEALGR